MDKRISLLSKVYVSHCKLVDVFHGPHIDNSSLLEFCNLYIDFVKALNPSRSNKRFDYIFTPSHNLEAKPVLNAHLLTASEYAETLVMRINENPSLDLANELIGVVFDYPKILSAVEKVYNIPFGTFNGNRNMQVDSYTSYKVASQLFWEAGALGRSNTLNGYSIFALRQAIELAGKELIGLENILNKNGDIFIYGTQVPWEFLALNKNAGYFAFPFDPMEIKKIFQWSNHFVHTGRNTFGYATALALRTVKQLYQKKPFINQWGQKDWQQVNEIKDFTKLKQDFGIYLENEYPGKGRVAKWRHPTLSFVSRD